MAEQTTSSKKKSIFLPVVAGSLLILFLGLFFIPNLLSTDWAAKKVQQAISTRIPGQVDFKDLSLSWFNGIHCEGITYDNQKKDLTIKVDDVTTSKGLFALATNYKELGVVNINRPVAYVYIKEKPSAAKTDAQAPSADEDTGQTEQPAQTAEPGPILSPITFPAITGKLTISDGVVITVLPDMKEQPVVKDLELQLTIAGLENILDYLVSFQSGDGTGNVKGEGTVTLPAGDITNLEKIQSQAKLDIENWEMADLLTILATSGDLPTGSGILNGHVDISGSSETAVKIQGKLTGQQIKLQGGPFKSDNPSLDRVEVAMDAEKTASAFVINQLALTSPLATGTISGVIGAQDKKEITSQAEIDLPQLFAQFPNTLSLKKGIKVLNGTIDISTKLSTTGKATYFDSNVRLDKLQGVAGKKKIAWDKPVEFVAKGEQSPDGIRLENFTVQSSFLNGKGQGDLNHMQIALTADIAMALKEIEKFIQLEGWKSQGKMDLNLQMDTKTSSLRRVSGVISIKDFVLQQKDRVIAPRGTFKADVSTDLRLDQEMRPREILDTVLDFQSWIGSGAVTLKRLVPPSGQTRIQFDDLGFMGGFDLNHGTTLLQTLDLLPKDTRLTGKADIKTRLSLKNDTLELADTSLETKNFQLKKAKQKFSEKKIQLTTRGSANLKQKSATLKPVDLKTSAGHIILPELMITDWSQLENSIKTNGSIDLDLGLLTTLLGDLAKLPPDTTVAGQAAINLNIDLTDAQQQLVKLDSTIGQIKVKAKNNPLLSEDNIRISLDLKGNISAQSYSFRKLDISTAPISVNATGSLVPEKKERLLTTEGSMTLDLKTLSTYLKSLADIEVEMTGTTKQPFTIKAKSINGEWGKISKFNELSTTFSAKSIRGYGLHIEALEVPIKLAQSLGEFPVQGTVNRGKMAFKPAIDFTVDPPLLTIPANSTILTGVGLNENMSNDLLAKVHPIFKGAAVSQGTVDLKMANFRWPLEGAARKDAAFAGSLIFNDVKLQAGGLLAPILVAMKEDTHEITLSEQPVEFVGKNDRVQCSPMSIIINEYTLLLTGSIGFDESLDYTAQIPVTRKMVGSDLYKYLEGTSITVPITGTVSKPAISKNVVQAALKDLIAQAGKKQITEQAGKLLQNLFK